MRVDLRLAVNYLPACSCLAKMLLLLAAISGIHPGQELGGYTLIGGVLYTDRLAVRNTIFDENAVLLTVYFANVHAQIRASSTRPYYETLMACLHLCWAVACAVLVAEPPMVFRAIERRFRFSRLFPSCVMVVIVCNMAFLHADVEPVALRAARALAFTMLSFVWIYLVGLGLFQGAEPLKENGVQGPEPLKESSNRVLVRMAPLLFSPFWVAVLFVPMACAALAYQNWRACEPYLLPDLELQPVASYARIEQEEPEPEEMEEVRLQELLRQAKQGAAR